MSLGKWIIAGLGWSFGGPIGGLLGYYLGKALFDKKEPYISSSFDSTTNNSRGPYHNTGTQADLTIALLVLVAAVMKADGQVKQSELNYVKKFLLKNFGEDKSKELLATLRDMVKKEIPVAEVCRQIKTNTDYSTRYHLLDFLIGLAVADLDFNGNEASILSTIRTNLGINLGDFISMCTRHNANYFNQGNQSYSNYNQSYNQSSSRRTSYKKDPYKVLGIEESASNEEIKKAYRRFAMKYHPDKVEHLGEEMKHNAEKQFREINEAYEEIKRIRGIK